MDRKKIVIGIALSLIGIGIVSVNRANASDKNVNNEPDEVNDLKKTKILDLIENSNVLLVGDSQIGRNIGKSLDEASKSFAKEVSMFFKEGTTPKKIMGDLTLRNGLLEAIESANPNVIIIQLGDNGISNTKEVSDFIDLIRSKSDGLIIWIGAHPVTIPKKESTYVFTDPSRKNETRYIDNYNKLKKNWNSLISSSVANYPNVIFFDPSIFFPTGSYSLNDMSTDGIHLDKEASIDFVDKFINFEG